MVQLYTPSDPYQFQNIICDLFNYLNQTNGFHIYGRNGQGQDGIDVVSWDHKIVVQCGLKDVNKANKKNVSDLKEKLKKDLESCLKENSEKITSFYLASTFDDDKNIQDYANALSQQYKIDIQYWGWGRISSQIELFPNDFRRIYSYLYTIDNPDIVFITDKKYPQVPNYIPRTIREFKLSGAGSSVNINDLILLDETRTLLLANPGMGKSIELEQLAYNQSHKEKSHKEKLEFLPIFCGLNRYKGDLEKLLESENIRWKHLQSRHLLLLLDAMDEIQEQYRDSFITDIEQFCQFRPKSKVIITCRNNFRRNIKGFDPFELDDFSFEDVKRFLNPWDANLQNAFLEQAVSNKIDDLLLTPFYLCALKQIFEINNYMHLPHGKAKILEELFEIRLKQDQIKRGSLGEKITSRSIELKKSIQKIAVSAELLGCNLIDSKDLQKIEQQHEIRELLKHSFLFNKLNNEEGKWQFEHNNFQEFLAAQVLARQSLKTIKRYVSYEPRFNFLKPSWANTINLLLSILDPIKDNKFNNLVSWLSEIQPDIFVRTEYYRLDKNTRQYIFKKIFNDAKEKSLWIERKYTTLEELSKFSGGGIEIGKFLIKEIEEQHNHQSLVHAILLLGYTENLNQLSHIISDLLKSTIYNTKNDKLGRGLIGYVLETASRLNIKLGELSPDYLTKIGFNDSSSIRASVYNYILSLNESEKEVSILLQGIQKSRHSSMISPGRDFIDEEGDPYNMSEEFNLEKCLMAIKDEANIKSILDALFDDYRSTFRDGITQNIWPRLIENCVNIYPRNPDILFKITEHAIMAFRHSRNDLYLSSLKQFYDETDTLNLIYDYCLERSKDDWFHCIDVFKTICTKGQLEKFISLYKVGQLNDNQILFGRAILRDLNSDLHEQFQHLLIIDHGNKFRYQENIDYEKERKKSEKRDLELLFDRSQFFNELFAAFNGLGKKIVDRNCIWDNYRSENYHLSIIKNTLLDLGEPFGVSKDQLDRFSNDVDWAQFQIDFLYKRISNSTSYELEEHQKQFIIDWCGEEIKKVNFKSSFYYETENSYFSSPSCHYLLIFFLEFALDFGKEKELEMLWYDSFAPRLKSENNQNKELNKSRLVDKLIEKYGELEIRNNLIINLQTGIDNHAIYMTHWRICEHLDCKEATILLPDYFTKPGTSEWDKNELVTIFEKLNGDFNLLEQFIPTNIFNDTWQWTLLEYLCENRSQKAVKTLLEILKRKPSLNDTNTLHAAFILAVNGQVEGFEFSLKWATAFKQCPPKHTIPSQVLLKLDPAISINLLLKYFDLSNQVNYQERRFENQARVVFEALLEIGKSSNVMFDKINKHAQFQAYKFVLIRISNENHPFRPIIRRINGLYAYLSKKIMKELKSPMYIHNFIKELETRYYSNKSSQVELDEVLELNKSLV